MKPLIIAHDEDPDGIISRVLLMRQFSLGGRTAETFEHIFVRYDGIVEAFEQAVGKSDLIYVADVNVNPRLRTAGGSEFALLEKLMESYQNTQVSWFDHHDGTLKHEDALAQLGIIPYYRPNQCAALLIAQVFSSLKNPYDRKLVQIAQAHDYKDTSSDHENIQIGNELEKIIALANESLNFDLLLELSLDLQHQRCFDPQFRLTPQWQDYIDQFTQRETAAYQELDKTIEIAKAGEYQVLFGYSSSLLSQKNGPLHLCKEYKNQADIFVCLFRSPVRNHIMVAPTKSTFLVVPFVENLGGGGDKNRNSGGFTLDYDVTPENYQNVKEMLLSQIEKYS